MKPFLWAAAMAVASMAGVAARAETVDIQWSDQGHFENHVAIQHGKIVEACARLVPGDKVKWRFDSREAVDFNIHYHAGHQVQYPARHDATLKSEGVLEVASTQDYCWMWSTKANNGLDVQFALDRSR